MKTIEEIMESKVVDLNYEELEAGHLHIKNQLDILRMKDHEFTKAWKTRHLDMPKNIHD